VPRFHCRLITELLAYKQAEGSTLRDLARELGIDETLLVKFRSGVRSPTKQVLVKIARRYGHQLFVRDLVWHHLVAECNDPTPTTEDALADANLPPRVAGDLRAYVVRFSEESLRSGRGLYITSSDATALSRASKALGLAFGAARVPCATLRADQRPDARAVRAAMAASVVVIERVDFACDAVADILLRRSDLLRPSVATSMALPDAIVDPHLRRVALSMMRRLVIGDAASTKTTVPVATNRTAS
jgi:transcriptional regulator with XRE-family HTH domain